MKSHLELPSVKGSSWPLPVIADGKRYICDQATLLVYKIKK